MKNNETNPPGSTLDAGTSAENLQHFVGTAHEVDLAVWLAEIPHDSAAKRIKADVIVMGTVASAG